MSWGDYGTAARFKRVVRELFMEFLEVERPRQSYGIVQAWDIDQRECLVTFPADPDEDPHEPIKVALTHFAPTQVGQTVIIDGPRTARRVVAVVGEVATFKETKLCKILGNASAPVDGSGTYAPLPLPTLGGESSSSPMSAPNASRITIPTDEPGWWMLGGAATFAASATGRFGLRIASGSATYVSHEESRSTATLPLSISLATLEELNGGEVISLQGTSSSATTTTSRALWAIKMEDL